jgi:hypothetical protein
MKTEAQEYFKKLEKDIEEGIIKVSDITTDKYNDAMLNARREAYENQQEQALINEAEQAKAKQDYINHLREHGFELPKDMPTESDWKRAYNKPEYFGKYHEATATAKSVKGTLDDFIQFCRQYGY